jgi:hypothetical protein
LHIRDQFASPLFSYGSPPIAVYWTLVQPIQIHRSLFLCSAWFQALSAIPQFAIRISSDFLLEEFYRGRDAFTLW